MWHSKQLTGTKADLPPLGAIAKLSGSIAIPNYSPLFSTAPFLCSTSFHLGYNSDMAYGVVSQAGLWILTIFACLKAYRRVILHFARQRIIREHGCKPIQGTYPHKDPILGSDYIRDAFAAKSKGEFLVRESRLYDQLGPTYVFYVLGIGMISTAEPENMKAIFATKFDDWSTGERNRVLEPLLGHGIFTTEGDHWARSRVMIRPNFVRSQISDLDRLEEHVDDFLRLIPPDGQEVDLQPLFFRLMMDSATDLLFGQSVNSLRELKDSDETQPERPSGNAFAHAFDTAQEYCNARFLYGPLGKIMPQAKEDKHAVALCREFIKPYVEQAVRYRQELDRKRADGVQITEEKYTFLHELAKETTDPIRLRDELMNLLVAGRDTTASMLSNLFHVLAKRPDVWGKLRAEVLELGGTRPSFEKLKDMKYLQYCIKECEYPLLFLSLLFKVSNSWFCSTPAPPACPWARPRGKQGHRPPGRRRQGRQIAALHQEGQRRHARLPRDAPAQRPLRPRC
jgi:cytochrome P450